jgi:PTH1 family peptidyl-tRNA hydrolase
LGVNSGGNDHRGHNKALKSIIASLGTSNFSRIGLGIGKPETKELEIAHLYEIFGTLNRETDLIGLGLDTAGQAIQHFVAFNDLKATKKRYCSSKKVPKDLKKLPGLAFPVEIVEAE